MLNHSFDYMRGYFAGAIFGDGCKGFTRTNDSSTHRLRQEVEIQATDIEMVEFVQECGSELFNVDNKVSGPQKNGKNKLTFTWRTMRKNVVSFVNTFIPFSPEEWRGFIAGLYDAEGGSFEVDSIDIGQKVSFENQLLMKSVQSFIARAGVIFTYSESDGMICLRLQSMPVKEMEGFRLSPFERHRLCIDAHRRFFDFFRPKIKRKYGSLQEEFFEN